MYCHKLYSLLDIATNRVWTLAGLNDGELNFYVAGGSYGDHTVKMFDTNTGDVVQTVDNGFPNVLPNTLIQLKSGYLAIGYAENFANTLKQLKH